MPEVRGTDLLPNGMVVGDAASVPPVVRLLSAAHAHRDDDEHGGGVMDVDLAIFVFVYGTACIAFAVWAASKV